MSSTLENGRCLGKVLNREVQTVMDYVFRGTTSARRQKLTNDISMACLDKAYMCSRNGTLRVSCHLNPKVSCLFRDGDGCAIVQRKSQVVNRFGFGCTYRRKMGVPGYLYNFRQQAVFLQNLKTGMPRYHHCVISKKQQYALHIV